MTLTSNQRRRADALTAKAAREVGVLLVALAALDFGFSGPTIQRAGIALCFMTLGVFFAYLGLRLERRLEHAD